MDHVKTKLKSDGAKKCACAEYRVLADDRVGSACKLYMSRWTWEDAVVQIFPAFDSYLVGQVEKKAHVKRCVVMMPHAVRLYRG